MYGINDIYNAPAAGGGVFAETLGVTMDEIDDDEEMGALLGIGKGGGLLGIALTQKAKRKKVARLLSKLKKFIALEEAGKKVSIKKVWNHAKAMNRTLRNLEKKGYDLSDEEMAWREFAESGKGDVQAWEDLKDKLSGTGEYVEEEEEEGEEYDEEGPAYVDTSMDGGGVRGGRRYVMRPLYRRHPPGWRPPAYSSFRPWRQKRWLARHPRLASVQNRFDPRGWQPGMVLPAPRRIGRRRGLRPGRGQGIRPGRRPVRRPIFRSRPAPVVRRPVRRPIFQRRPSHVAERDVARGIRRGERAQAPIVRRGLRLQPWRRSSGQTSVPSGGGRLNPGKRLGRGLGLGRGRRQDAVATGYGFDEDIEAGVSEAMGALPGTIGIDAFAEAVEVPSNLTRGIVLGSHDLDDNLDIEDIYDIDDDEDFGACYGEDTGIVQTERKRLRKFRAHGHGPFRRKLTARLASLEKKYKRQVETGHPRVGETYEQLQAVKDHYNKMLGRPQVQTVTTVHEQEGIEKVPLFKSSMTPAGWGEEELSERAYRAEARLAKSLREEKKLQRVLREQSARTASLPEDDYDDLPDEDIAEAIDFDAPQGSWQYPGQRAQ